METDVSPAGGFVLQRSRLLDALDRALVSRLALVVAPAGFGKSELITQWLARHGTTHSVRLSLDERDNDPGRFWQSLVAGMARHVPQMAEGPARVAQILTPGSTDVLVESIRTVLADEAAELVIVLDDFHFIHDPTILDSVDLFRDEVPESVHLIVSGRHDPRLPVSRLRVRGELTEVREADLRFTLEETAELLAGSGVVLGEVETALLHERTEGWGAALRLAVLSMKAATDPAIVVRDISGTDRMVADYLFEEVVGEMSPDRQTFLLSTSIADELDGELARELSGREDSAALLGRLAAEGLFTTPLPGRDGWFRYHRLLRDLLRARLRHESPELSATLHLRAAEWHHNQGNGPASVQHALAGGDVELASRWLGTVAPALVARGNAVTVAELSASVMEAVDEPDALVLLTRWWALYMVAERPDEFEDLGARVEAALAALPEEEPGDIHGGKPTSLASRASLPWLRGLRARARGDLDTLLELDDPSAIPSPSGRVEGWLAEGLLWIGRARAAEPLIATWLEHAEHDRYLPSTVHGLGLDALAAAELGELGRAREDSERALRIAEENGFDQLAQTAYARLVTTWLAWTRGDLPTAEASALAIQQFWDRSSEVAVIVQQALLRSRIRWSLGDRLGARSLLDRASVGVSGRPVTGHFAERILLGRATLDLLDDEFESAERWLPDWRRRLESEPTTMREYLVLLRMAVAAGSLTLAIETRAPAEVQANPRYASELDRLRAMAYLQDGRVDDATEALARSLRTADTIGMVQPTLDDRSRLATILGTAMRHARVELPGLVDTQAASEGIYVEPLSERERTILELMATHMSYPEMADELFISPNTVKSHVKTIFRKLAVGRRSEAVSQGRAYGLIR